MIAEAVDTLWAMGWALFAWIAAAATVVTLLLLGTVAGVWQACRAVRSAYAGARRSLTPPETPQEPAQTRIAPSWAITPPPRR